MGTAYKAEWYDLDDADRANFIDWLHGKYLPALQTKPGYIWVGHYDRAGYPDFNNTENTTPNRPPLVTTDDPIGQGSQYLLLIAAASADLFFDPNTAMAIDDEIQAQLAKRKGYRRSVFVEESSVNGPDWHRHLPGSGAPPAMQLGNFNTRDESDELEVAFWYRQLRFPQITRTPGCIGARKLVSVVGWAHHGILYEFMGLEEGERNFEMRFRAAGFNEDWQGKHILDLSIHGPYGPHAGRRIWPPLQ